MSTSYTTAGKLRYRHKFAIIFAVAIALLLTHLVTSNTYLVWGSAITFVIAMPYAILSIMEIVDKLNQ